MRDLTVMAEALITDRLEEFLADYEVYAEACLEIITLEGESVPFIFNRVQRHLWRDIIKPKLAAGEPVRINCLKGRQMGTSTFFLGLLSWIIFLRRYKRGMIIAHDEDSSRELYGKIQYFFKMLPDPVRPKYKTNNRGEIHLADPDPTIQTGLESKALVDTALNINIGRSQTLQFYLLSELAFWKEDPKPRLVSIHQACKRRPGTIGIIETTANGQNYYAELWDRDDNYDKVFICWVAEESYRVEVELDAYPILSNSMSDKFGDEEAEYGYVKDAVIEWYPEEYKAGGDKWLHHEIMCRIMWRRYMIEGDLEDDVNEFYKEYPTIPKYAFATKGAGVFPNFKLADILVYLRDKPYPCAQYRWDYHKKGFYLADYGQLKLYEKLHLGELYAVACDPARGVEGGDPTAISILRVADVIYEVGTYAEITPPDVAAAMVDMLGRACGNALLGVEVNDAGGYYIVDKLQREYKYPNLYRRESWDSITKRPVFKYGFYSTGASKDSLISDFRKDLVNDTILLRDPATVEQLMRYQELPNGKLGVPPPGHDDRVIATVLARHMARHTRARPGRKKKPPKYSMDWWAKTLDKPSKPML